MSYMCGVSKGWMAASAALALCLVGCESEGDKQVDDIQATPVPVNSWYRVSSLAISADTTTIDIDGDGNPDDSSGLQDAFDAIHVAIYAAVDVALDDAGIPEECSEDEPVCQVVILAAVDQLLSELLSVDAISEALSQPIEDGDVNYLMNFDGVEGSTLTLGWLEGTTDGTTWTGSTPVGQQTGTLNGTGSGTFSADQLVLTLTLETTDPRGGSETTEIPFTLYDWVTAISSYSETGLSYVSGAAVTEEDILTLTEEVLTAVNQLLIPTGEQIDIPTVIAQVSAALQIYLNVDVDSNGVDDSIAFVVDGQSESVVVAEAAE